MDPKEQQLHKTNSSEHSPLNILSLGLLEKFAILRAEGNVFQIYPKHFRPTNNLFLRN